MTSAEETLDPEIAKLRSLRQELRSLEQSLGLSGGGPGRPPDAPHKKLDNLLQDVLELHKVKHDEPINNDVVDAALKKVGNRLSGLRKHIAENASEWTEADIARLQALDDLMDHQYRHTRRLNKANDTAQELWALAFPNTEIPTNFFEPPTPPKNESAKKRANKSDRPRGAPRGTRKPLPTDAPPRVSPKKNGPDVSSESAGNAVPGVSMEDNSWTDMYEMLTTPTSLLPFETSHSQAVSDVDNDPFAPFLSQPSLDWSPRSSDASSVSKEERGHESLNVNDGDHVRTLVSKFQELTREAQNATDKKYKKRVKKELDELRSQLRNQYYAWNSQGLSDAYVPPESANTQNLRKGNASGAPKDSPPTTNAVASSVDALFDYLGSDDYHYDRPEGDSPDLLKMFSNPPDTEPTVREIVDLSQEPPTKSSARRRAAGNKPSSSEQDREKTPGEYLQAIVKEYATYRSDAFHVLPDMARLEASLVRSQASWKVLHDMARHARTHTDSTPGVTRDTFHESFFAELDRRIARIASKQASSS